MTTFYILTFEDGKHHQIDDITDAELQSVRQGVLTIIRISISGGLVEEYTGSVWQEVERY